MAGIPLPGEKAIQLIRELKRNETEIIPYERETVEGVLDETVALYQEIASVMRDNDKETRANPYVASNLVVNHQYLLRNKRLLLAYLVERARRIQKLRWELGPILPNSIKSNLSESEHKFFRDYEQLITDTMRSLQLDLTIDLQQPPKDLYIEVRVLQNFGEIMTENGVVVLQKNTTHFLPRTDVEPLIRQGILQHIV